MKKTFLAFLIVCAMMSTVHAQQTVIVQKTPGLLESLVDATIAIASAPVVFGTAIVSGVGEVFAPAITGSTRVTYINQPPVVTAPVVAPAPVVAAPVVAPAPVVVAPPIISEECYRTPYTSTTTISTQTVSPSGTVTVQTYTRPISAYETGIPLAPVPIEHRVGTSPVVNPYVYRHR